MTQITWDNIGERFYETGVDHGVLYLPDPGTGLYEDGVPWNGLTTVTETPAGADSNKQYADNTVYVNLLAAETFGGTIEAFTYPDEFAECDGSASPVTGVAIGQQGRRPFGLSYRTAIGNDLQGNDHGYKLHLVYGAQASPSERAYATINDSPAPIAFSWGFDTTPAPVTGHKPTSLLTIDSTTVDADALAALEEILYGTSTDDPRLPLPDEVIADLALAANQPTFDAATGVVTLPAIAGVQWKVGGVNKAPGAQPAIASGSQTTVRATAQAGFNLEGDDRWTYERP
jgi:hypothetical protein